MSNEFEELANKRRRWVESERENGADKGMKRLLTELYPDNAHFIYELLQNAEDAQANVVRFILNQDFIEFEHSGKRLFSIDDIDSITNIGASTKREEGTSIGKFGVGFKAVFAYTDTPEIHSGDYNFRIRDMRIPEAINSDLNHDSALTRFIFPFDNPKKSPEQARSEVERLLKALGATTLLFLAHISKIEYLLPDSSLGYIERIELDDNRFEIRVQNPHENSYSSSCYLKFNKEVKIEDDEVESESQKVKSCRIALAFGLSQIESKAGAKEKKAKDTDASPGMELVPLEPGRVCIYFPADKETSNLRFHIHATFASTVARDSVRDCAGNNLLRNHLADLLTESMSAIRNQGLLTLRALAVLPNDKDNLSEFYQPLMTRLVREFKEQDLVPMKCGGHAAACDIFRGSKAISDLIDDDDMVTLLGDDYFPPMWAANPSQRNQREDNFLTMIDIKQWNIAELVKALGSLNKDSLVNWINGKDEKWHQDFYLMLIDFINAAPKYPKVAATERKNAIKRISLVRCSDGIYRKGSECFFPNNGIEHDVKFPRVAMGMYIVDKVENKKAREFLETVGVREVDEKAEIEYILKERYSHEAVEKKQFRPEVSDMAQFIAFAEKHPGETKLFQSYFIFKLANGLWGKPDKVFLDVPFMDTGLNIYYQIIGSTSERYALSEEYEAGRINPEEIGKFANKLGANTVLSIKPVNDYCSKDYTIEHIENILTSKNINASRLIWRTCVSRENDYPSFYDKQSRPDGRYNFSYDGDSSIIATLKKYNWVPQKSNKTIEFVQPRDAVAEKLPEGFAFQTDLKCLKVLEFGLGVKERLEAQRRAKEQQSQEYKRREEAAKDFGFDSPEEAEEMAKLMKENPEGFKKLKDALSQSRIHPTFPTRLVANPERRQERFCEQLTDAPNKQYEKRERSVRTTNGAIDPITWLRNQYTNEADQMVCQICKEEMPFRKRDGTHHFEKKEVLSRKYMPKEHEAQYLALCPLCAAKYDEFVKTDDEVMIELRGKIACAEDYEIPISLGDEQTSIRFVETHLHDLKVIIDESE